MSKSQTTRAIGNLVKARELLTSATANRVKATRMQPDSKTARDLRDRAHRQEDQANALLDAVASFLSEGIAA